MLDVYVYVVHILAFIRRLCYFEANAPKPLSFKGERAQRSF